MQWKSGSGEGLGDEESTDEDEACVDDSQKRVATEAAIDPPANKNGGEDRWKGEEVIVGDIGCPEAGEVVADEPEGAGGEEVGLERGAEVLCRPAAEGAVDDKGRAIHAVSAAGDAGEESAGEEEGEVILFEMRFFMGFEGPGGEGDDERAKDGFDEVFIGGAEKPEAQGDAKGGGGDEPRGAFDVDVAVVLDDNNECNGDGDEDGKRSGSGDGEFQGKEGDGDEGFAEAEGGADEGGDEEDADDVEKGGIGHSNTADFGWNGHSAFRTAIFAGAQIVRAVSALPMRGEFSFFGDSFGDFIHCEKDWHKEK